MTRELSFLTEPHALVQAKQTPLSAPKFHYENMSTGTTMDDGQA